MCAAPPLALLLPIGLCGGLPSITPLDPCKQQRRIGIETFAEAVPFLEGAHFVVCTYTLPALTLHDLERGVGGALGLNVHEFLLRRALRG